MAISPWLTFENIKDIQLNYLNLKSISFFNPPVAVSGGLNEQNCNGIFFVETTVPGITFTVDEDRAKAGTNAIFHNKGTNAYDFITGVGTYTQLPGESHLFVKVDDAPVWIRWDLPNPTILQ